jgi:hypothetical protein
LKGVEEDEETQNLVVSDFLIFRQIEILGLILVEIDLFRDPEVIHGLPIPTARPLVPHVVEIVEVRGIEIQQSLVIDIGIPIRIE